MIWKHLKLRQRSRSLSIHKPPPHTKVVPNVVYPHFYNYYKSIVSCIKPRDLGTKTPEKSKLRGRFLKWVQG